LRNEPWENIPNVPELYPEYAKTYDTDPITPISTPKLVKDHAIGMDLGDSLTQDIPSTVDICNFLQEALNLDTERTYRK